MRAWRYTSFLLGMGERGAARFSRPGAAPRQSRDQNPAAYGQVEVLQRSLSARSPHSPGIYRGRPPCGSRQGYRFTGVPLTASLALSSCRCEVLKAHSPRFVVAYGAAEATPPFGLFRADGHPG